MQDLIEWLEDRRRNALRLGNNKLGDERRGWFEDASYFERARDAVARINTLEEAITEVSLQLCESTSPEAKKAMQVFGKVMDAAAMKRMGI